MGQEDFRKAERIIRKLDKIRNIKDIRNELPWHPTRRWKTRDPGSIKRIVVHTTGSSNQDPFKTNNYHIHPNHISKEGCPKICYANFTNQDGLIYLCNDYTDITWHCGLWNSSSIGLVMAFKGQIDTEKPTDKQYLSMVYQCSKLCTEFNIHPHNVIGHREVPGMYTILGNGSKKYKKSCPGMAISLPFLRKNVIITLQSQMTLNGLYTAKIDGLWGKLSAKGFKQLVSDCKKEQCDDSK